MLVFFRKLPPWLLFTFISQLCTLKTLLGNGGGANQSTLVMASQRLWAGVSLYAPPDPGSTYYKYSPVFAWLYSPFAGMPGMARAFLWGSLNIAFFWFGITRWIRIDKKASGWVWLGILVCSMELDGAVRHLQTNALLVGVMLCGLADFRDNKLVRSSAALWWATSTKIFPGLILVPLVLARRFRFWVGLGAAGLVAFLLPATLLGWSKNLDFHREWVYTLFFNAQPGKFTDAFSQDPARLLSLANAFTISGLRPLGVALSGLVLVGTLVGLCFPFVKKEKPNWNLWIAQALTAMILLNPGTEGATFVVAAPSIVFLIEAMIDEKRFGRFERGIVIAGMLGLTVMYNDIWPRFLWNPREFHSITKPLALLLLWSLASAKSLAPRLNRSSDLYGPLSRQPPVS